LETVFVFQKILKKGFAKLSLVEFLLKIRFEFDLKMKVGFDSVKLFAVVFSLQQFHFISFCGFKGECARL